MSDPKYTVKLDIQHVRRQWNAYVHAADTPILRCYLYQNGKQWEPPTGWTAQLGLGSDFEDSESLVIVDGTSGYGSGEANTNFFDFDFSAGDVADSGDYFAQVILKNSTETQQFVFGDGTLHILPSPISGEHTATTLTSVVNWDVIENTGTVPWPDSTETVSLVCGTDITLDSDDAGKTWVLLSTCSSDVTVTLPDASSTTTIGSVYKFINKSGNVLKIQSGASDHIDELIDGNAIYTGEGGINDNAPYASIRIKQIAANEYHAMSGRLKWTYEG